MKDRKKFLPKVLETIPLQENTPLYHTGHPLQAPSENVLWLLNHCPDEAHVFSTHARAPLLLVFEGKRVQVEDVDRTREETEGNVQEDLVDSETQDNLRRACRSYVLTPFGVAVLATALGYSGHIDIRFALGFAMASVIVGIVLWRVYARKLVSLTKVTNILVKKYSSTVLGSQKKKKKKKKTTIEETNTIEKEEKEEKEEDETKSRPMIAIEGWVKKSGKSLLGTSFQKRFVVFFRHTRSIAWYTDETKTQKLNELSLIGYTASVTDLTDKFEISLSHASGVLRNLKLRFKDRDHLSEWYTVLDCELHSLSRSIAQRRSLRMQLTELSSDRLERIVSGASSVSSRNSSSSLRVNRDFPEEEEEEDTGSSKTAVKKKDSFGITESTGFARLKVDSPTVVVTRDDIRDVEKVEKDILGWVNDRRGSLRPPPVVADSFGETWKEKTQRILGASKKDSELVSLIAKSFDDLRQEVFTMQLIEEMKKIWSRAHVPVYVRSYTILSTYAFESYMYLLTQDENENTQHQQARAALPD